MANRFQWGRWKNIYLRHINKTPPPSNIKHSEISPKDFLQHTYWQHRPLYSLKTHAKWTFDICRKSINGATITQVKKKQHEDNNNFPASMGVVNTKVKHELTVPSYDEYCYYSLLSLINTHSHLKKSSVNHRQSCCLVTNFCSEFLTRSWTLTLESLRGFLLVFLLITNRSRS